MAFFVGGSITVVSKFPIKLGPDESDDAARELAPSWDDSKALAAKPNPWLRAFCILDSFTCRSLSLSRLSAMRSLKVFPRGEDVPVSVTCPVPEPCCDLEVESVPDPFRLRI